jgi:hypothetical protein
MYNKSEIMKNAWFYFKQGWYNKDFSVCLKKAWTKAKKAKIQTGIVIRTEVAQETEKAVKLSTDFGYIWIPKSAIDIQGEYGVVKTWFFNSLDSNKKYALQCA